MLGTILLVIALGLHGLRLMQDLPVDRVRADLRLGDYQSAAQRAERIEDLDPVLAAAARLAGTIGYDGVEPARIEYEVRAAQKRGDLAGTESWHALLELRR